MNAHEQIGTILQAAQEYAALGWQVFPAPPGEKKSHKSAEHSGGRNGAQPKTRQKSPAIGSDGRKRMSGSYAGQNPACW